MSIVIDEDDDLMIVDNNIQTVYTDDKKENYQKLVEVIERDLNDRVDLFADAYANIYKHYDNAVKKLLDDKEELDKKIQDAFQERKEIIKEMQETQALFANLEANKRTADAQAEVDFNKCLQTEPDYIEPDEMASISEEEAKLITFNGLIDLNSETTERKVLVEVSQEILRANGVPCEEIPPNPWSLSKPLPSILHGKLFDIGVKSDVQPDGHKYSNDMILINTVGYHILLEPSFQTETHQDPVGIIVKYDEFAYQADTDTGPGQFQIGQRVIAPLHNLESDDQTQTHLYKGFVIEPPKSLTYKHGNDLRVLIFFDCGIWRYVNPSDVWMFHPPVHRTKTATAKYESEIYLNCEPFPFEQIYAKRNHNSQGGTRPIFHPNFPDSSLKKFSDQKMMEYLLTPKPNGKKSIGYMVATNDIITSIEVRPPTRLFHVLFKAHGNQTPFLTARIVKSDCNIILCEWTNEAGDKYSEWIFKGSPQIMKLFSRFEPTMDNVFNRSRNGTAKRMMNLPRYQLPRQQQNKRQRQTHHIQSMVDLTGDEGKIEDFTFIYVKEPISKANAIVNQKGHQCTSLCINYNVSSDDLEKIRQTPLLLRPYIFGFRRFPITNERLIRDAEAECDKINCFYRGPCNKDIYDRATLDKYLVDTAVGEFLEHDCFSFDKSVLLNRRVDKTKLKGLVLDDISDGKEPKRIPMYNQVDDQQPPPLDYKVEPVLSDSVRINMEQEFVSCCECTDGCRGSSKGYPTCPCKSLTVQGAKKINALYTSYNYGRLVDIIATGIYECGNSCLCRRNTERPCQNSIVQRGIRQELQLFKTFKKGWGIRTMCDIPFGAFICIYTGVIRKEDEAESSGRTIGDEYFANLNYIESAEATKVEVKKNMIDSGHEMDDSFTQSDEESEEDVDRPVNSAEFARRLRKRKTKKKKPKEKKENSEESDSDEEWSKTREYFQTEDEMKLTEEEKAEGKSKRIMFVVDAKQQGNLGRYLNHSCNPNLDTQNVIINTADLRFPTVAFFAKRNIKAGEELCWDYQYELSDDVDRALICYCGAANCRGRLR